MCDKGLNKPEFIDTAEYRNLEPNMSFLTLSVIFRKGTL